MSNTISLVGNLHNISNIKPKAYGTYLTASLTVDNSECPANRFELEIYGSLAETFYNNLDNGDIVGIQGKLVNTSLIVLGVELLIKADLGANSDPITYINEVGAISAN